MENINLSIKDQLEVLKQKALEGIESAGDLAKLEEMRLLYFGKKGEMTRILKGLGKLSAEERPLMGKIANDIKQDLTLVLDQRIKEIKDKELEEKILSHRIDITLPGKKPPAGRLHPLTQILREIKSAFIGMGFEVVEGPEVETEYYNFEALNIPADHPSREMWDSFYFRPGLLLRSHTSPVQVRAMEKRTPPVRIISCGKCYRRDAVDATHHWAFNQVEALLIDDKTTFSDLKGILLQLARKLFGQKRQAKFSPSYFPFTEPSADMAIDCFICQGKGCRVCKYSGWIELLGAGMVNPRVLKMVGYHPEKYQGFALGLGVERTAMLKYAINDIRIFYDNDLRFLEQF